MSTVTTATGMRSLESMGFDSTLPPPNPLAEPLKAVPAPQQKYDDYSGRPWFFCTDFGLADSIKTLRTENCYGNTMIGIGGGFAVLDLAAERRIRSFNLIKFHSNISSSSIGV